MFQYMLAIWFLVPLPFLSQACRPGNSWFMYFWRLTWGIFNTTLLACVQFRSVQSLSNVRLLMTAWTAARQASLSVTNSQSLHVHCVGDPIQSSHPLLYPSPSALNLPSIRVFSKESALHIRWPNYWSFSFNISPSNKNPRLISFRMDWLDLLAVQRHSGVFSNTTVQKYQFFGAQLSLQSNSHIHKWPAGKTIALTRWNFLTKWSLCFLIGYLGWS